MSGWWCCCQCPYCRGAHPKELEVTIAGLTDRDCGDCDVLNDTFVLDFIGDGPSGCCWVYRFDETCGFDILVACISKPIALGYQLEVAISREGGSLDVIVWVASLGEDKPRCRDWSGLNVPITPQIQSQCHDNSSTCTISVP